MSGSVSVPGPNGSTITQTFSNSFNETLAKSISDALAAAQTSGSLNVASYTGTNSIPAAVPGKINELVVDLPANSIVTVPAGYAYLVDNSPGPDTIYGSPGMSIMGGGGNHTIIDPALITLGDTSGGSTNVVTVTGVGDNVAVGNGANTLTGTGSGTLSGGTGTNLFIETAPGGQYLINSQGQGGDTIRAGDGGSTVNSSGANAVIFGGKGALTALISGSGSEVVGAGGELTAIVSGANDTIFGGGAVASVTLSGSTKAVVAGSAAELSVLDNGTGDTIDAGVSASITAPGGSFVIGGTGPLNFVGGTGPSTIVGGSGPASVFGGTGLTSVIGSAGGSVTYVNTTQGGLGYVAGNGSETLDASLSKAQSTLFGGQNTGASDLIIGGAGGDLITGSAGSDTLVGSGGQNGFYFWANLGGPSATHVISDFSAIDYVFLGNYGANAASAAIAGAMTSGGSTTITLSDNTKITFTGVTNSAALNGHIVST